MFTIQDFRRRAQAAGAMSNHHWRKRLPRRLEVGHDMQSKLNTDPPQPGPGDRRSGVDRRRADVDLAGKHERRRGVESRKPEVVELDMSNSEWTALNQDSSTPGS